MNNGIMFCDAAPAAAGAETSAATVEVPAAPAAEGGSRPAQQGGFGMMVPMLLILAIFYFMMIRPQQRKEKERRRMIEELRAGAKVVFAGGFMGTIVEATEQTFRIEISPGTIVEVARGCVSGVVADGAAEAAK